MSCLSGEEATTVVVDDCLEDAFSKLCIAWGDPASSGDIPAVAVGDCSLATCNSLTGKGYIRQNDWSINMRLSKSSSFNSFQHLFSTLALAHADTFKQ